MTRRAWLRIATAAAVCLACLAPAVAECQAPAPSTGSQTRVLSLHTLRPESVWYAITERIYRQTLSDALGEDRLDYYIELLDVNHFPDSSYESDFEDYLVRKYQNRPLDLLIANGVTAAAVAGRMQARLESHPPIVFTGSVTERPVPKSTGHPFGFEMKGTLDLALGVLPETRYVYLVCGTSPADSWYEDDFRKQVPTSPPGVEFIHLRGLSIPALTDRLAALPEHSVVFLLALTSDAEGREFRLSSVIERLAESSNAPIFTWNGDLTGPFGGRFTTTELVAAQTIRLALRVLGGERPEDIPISSSNVSVDALDWRQLDRWNVSQARVPAGVELRFRQPGLFEQYRSQVLGAIGVVLLQTFLIAGLLIQRRNKRLAENSLRESEERFRIMADTAPVMIWRAGPDQRCDFFNQPWLQFRGRRLQEEFGEGWTDGVHPDDLQRCLKVYTGAWPGREPFRMEYRLQRADGEYRWVLGTGVPRLGPDGALLGYIGSCIDITERRHAEEALRDNEAALRQSHAEIEDLAGRLITAQEEERVRIARDLHDDIGQQVAAISIAISGCKRRPGMQGSVELLEALSVVQQQTVRVADDIRLLSHDLHPGMLEHASLADVLRSHCSDFAAQQSLRMAVEADADLDIADMTIALCLYRIVQEALHNIAKHAAARQVTVRLRRVDDEVQLTVTDDGKGFSLSTVRERGGGLGLRSIEERVRLVGGRLAIETAPGRGTTITVSVRILVATIRDLAGV